LHDAIATTPLVQPITAPRVVLAGMLGMIDMPIGEERIRCHDVDRFL